MENISTEDFFIKYHTEKSKMDKALCIACHGNYMHSFKYHTCFLMGCNDNNNQFMEEALAIVLLEYKVIITETQMKNLKTWINKNKNTLLSNIYLKDIIN